MGWCDGRYGKGHTMQACKCLGQLCIIPHQAAKSGCLRIAPLDHLALGQQHKTLFHLGQFDPCALPMVGLGILGGLLSRIALVDIREFDGIPRHVLHLLRQLLYLLAGLLVGGGDMPSQQIPQGIHRCMPLQAALAFRTIIARLRPPCGCRWLGAAVEDGGRGLHSSSLRYPQQGTQVMHHRCEDAGFEPALAVLVHRIPGRQTMGQQTPGRARPHHPAHPMKHLAQAMRALRGVCH